MRSSTFFHVCAFLLTLRILLAKYSYRTWKTKKNVDDVIRANDLLVETLISLRKNVVISERQGLAIQTMSSRAQELPSIMGFRLSRKATEITRQIAGWRKHFFSLSPISPIYNLVGRKHITCAVDNVVRTAIHCRKRERNTILMVVAYWLIDAINVNDGKNYQEIFQFAPVSSPFSPFAL